MTQDDTLYIHETVIEDAAFKIVTDLLNCRAVADDIHKVNVATDIIIRTLRHQLHLQRTWRTDDDDVSTRQLWSRPVQD